jgi:hypothetical protein
MAKLTAAKIKEQTKKIQQANVGIRNPDPSQAIWLFAHAWVGSGNVDPAVGTFLLNVDTRFPRLTEPLREPR